MNDHGKKKDLDLKKKKCWTRQIKKSMKLKQKYTNEQHAQCATILV